MTSVMVVEDEDVLLEMIAALIEDLGYRAVIATNGREALAALEAEPEPPLLIISDVMMPQMNGVALAQAVKQHPRLQGVPIVLMSAATRPPTDGIADHFIHKPFDLDHIERIIQRYNGYHSSGPHSNMH
jgi:CheY-like chemotaxis protein